MLSRAFDVVVSAVLLSVLSPLMVLIAVAIRIDSPGPAIFTQERLGRGCKPFRMRKFRTLRICRGEIATTVPKGDARVTRVGHWLRRFRLDELPQLLDVLIGSMALVGPRPEVPANLQAVAPRERERVLLVRPGITGPTQLDFIAEDELLAEVAEPTVIYRQILVPAKVRNDLAWTQSRTFWSDLMVILRTPMTLCSRRAWTRSRTCVKRMLTASGATVTSRH